MGAKKSDLVESSRGYGRASWQVWGFAALSGVCACSGESPSSVPAEAIAVESEGLAVSAGMRLFTEIPNNQVTVCFHRGAEDIRIKMRAAVERTWGTVARIRFVGWGDCPQSIHETWIPIDVFENTSPGDNGGNCKGGVGARQPRPEDGGDPRMHENTQLFINTGTNRANLEADTIHEMAHCLGVMHEHQRSDTPVACSTALQTTPPTGTGVCFDDSHCASNDCGSNNRCVLPDCGPTNDCTTGFTCRRTDSLCVPDRCRTASDCWGVATCTSGRCRTSCSASSQCPPGHSCDPNSGLCANADVVTWPDSQNHTPWDPTSIMTYDDCRSLSAPPEPSFWDIYGMRKLYGGRSALYQIVTSLNASSGDFALGRSAPAGYDAKHAEGWVWGVAMPGTAVLQLYFHPGSGDTWALATAGSRAVAEASGYLLRGTIGYVYTLDQGDATVPLQRFKHPVTLHRFVTASSDGEAAARAAGYTLMGTEGYVFPASEVPFQTLTYYWSSARNNAVLTRTGFDYAMHRADVGYVNRGLDGLTLKRFVQGTTPLRQFYSSSRSDDFATATAAGISDAQHTAYTEQLPHEGYVFTELQNGTQPLKLFWKASINDNWTTAERPNDSGYQFIRDEGFVMPARW